MKTEISHQELMYAWAPLCDVSMALDRLIKKADTNAILLQMDSKVKLAIKPLEEWIDRIESENPEKFG